ncbi:MAG: uroporphyrinogen decarboxylase family protein [Armatimonadota bacterium]
MKKRERVERAMALQETDRVPLYDLLYNDAVFEYIQGMKLPPLSADETTIKELNRIAGRAVAALLDMTRSPGFGPVEETDSTDDFGFVHHYSPQEKTSWIARRSFEDEEGGVKYLKAYTAKMWEKAEKITRSSSEYRERYHRGFQETQALIGDTVNLLAQQGTGLDEIRHRLGFEIYAYLEIDEPGLISEALEATTACHIAECHVIADSTLSPAVLTYGDIACKGRLLHSPEFLRREFFPRIKRLNDAWHEHGFKCLFHSDGYLMDVMDDLIDAGIDGLNPIETVAGMNLREVKEKYGDKIFLAGGIDMSQLLSNGTPDEVREVCRQAIRDASPGYLMGSTTESDNSCRLENLLAMYQVALGEVELSSNNSRAM